MFEFDNVVDKVKYLCYNKFIGVAMKYLLVVSYDGTNFAGFQKQKKGERTIQEELEKALKILLKQDVNVVASGRTDSGVHAYNQVCHIECDEIKDFYKFVRSMNGILPADVKVKSIQETKLHARFSAKRKTYLYKMYVSDIDLPLYDNFLRLPTSINFEYMKEAGELLIGEHDFANFCASGSEVQSTIRTIYNIKWKKVGEELHFYITGNGFLYKMVRNIVGLLVELGKGKINYKQFKDYAFGKLDKKFTAPARALYLYNVKY